MTEYTPDEEHMEVAWIEYDDSATDINEAAAQFDRFLARVRRDAAREALKQFRKTELAIIPPDADEDDPTRVRQQALAWRIEMHLLGNYPETEAKP